MPSEQPTILVIGATGQTGRLIVADFDRDPGNVRLRLAARKRADIEQMQAAGKDAVHFDLDDPQTFVTALAGVDRLFLLTGYTVAMLAQSKTLVDAARKAGVRHIVHQGIFGQWDCTDPHFAWHQMIETYIEASGIAWTHLHPNVFMDNLLTFMAPRGGKLTVFFGEQRVGWIALKDLAAVAAAVLRQGPEWHGGRNYWLSPEVLTGPQVADILSGVLETKISCEMQSPDVLAKMVAESGAMKKTMPKRLSSSCGRLVTDAWVTSAQCGMTGHS
jgi:NAD(P)H dehydrogenase (quinone)